MYESRKQPVLARARFMRRLLRHSAAALGLLAGSLAHRHDRVRGIRGSVVGRRISERVDAAGGMGPVDPPQTVAGKLFAGLYALYSGLVFIVTAAVLFAPILHRVLHRFHWDEKSR
jgi:hypothetical protein